jgi:hypothetical protein
VDIRESELKILRQELDKAVSENHARFKVSRTLKYASISCMVILSSLQTALKTGGAMLSARGMTMSCSSAGSQELGLRKSMLSCNSAG